MSYLAKVVIATVLFDRAYLTNNSLLRIATKQQWGSGLFKNLVPRSASGKAGALPLSAPGEKMF